MLASVVAGFVACDQSSAPNEAIFEALDSNAVNVEIVGYDSVHIYTPTPHHEFGKSAVKISIVAQNGADETEVLSTVPTYVADSSGWQLSFSLYARLNAAYRDIVLITRLLDKNKVILQEFYNPLSLYKYPYENASIILPYEKFNLYIQDIYRLGDRLFIHPLGSEGTYEYHLISKTLTNLFGATGGDHITVVDSFLLQDTHSLLIRYNLFRKTFTYGNTIPGVRYILGMDSFGGYLYLFCETNQGNQIRKYTSYLAVLDSIPYPRTGYYMTIHQGVAYTLGDMRIHRFDLTAKSYLPDLAAPAIYGDGIKISGDSLYYCNYYKKFVGVVPLADVLAGVPLPPISNDGYPSRLTKDKDNVGSVLSKRVWRKDAE